MLQPYLSYNNCVGPSDVWSIAWKFLNGRLSIKPNLYKSSWRLPRGANRVPHVQLVVQTFIFCLFIPDMGLQLFIGFIPENQYGIGMRGCCHREKDVVPFQVCVGPADNAELLIILYQSKRNSILHIQSYLWQTVTVLKSCFDPVSFTWAVLVSCGKINIFPDISEKRKNSIEFCIDDVFVALRWMQKWFDYVIIVGLIELRMNHWTLSAQLFYIAF